MQGYWHGAGTAGLRKEVGGREKEGGERGREEEGERKRKEERVEEGGKEVGGGEEGHCSNTHTRKAAHTHKKR